MELSTAQRFVAFAAAVIVLAGLGVYLFLPQPSATGAPRRGHSPSGQPSRAGTPAPSASANPGGTAGPAQGAANIYQWLPFSQAGLTTAARVTTEFAADYGTFSYTQSTAAYLAPMKPLMNSELAQVIGRAFSAPGLAGVRTSRKQVSAGSAAITSMRAFGPSSITFVVAITQRMTDTRGHSQQVTDYAVTLTGSGTNWQVSDIELASLGNP
jgi:hypothetical protein